MLVDFSVKKKRQPKRQSCPVISNFAAQTSIQTRNPATFNELLGKRADHDVIPVRISECEFHSSSVRVQVGLLLELSDESACTC